VDRRRPAAGQPRLEPEKKPVQAARAAGRAAAAVDSKRTETRFDTPDSSIVTP
jgi:hypothetical protein